MSQAEPRVWLVGAGPGDPELLTLKALRLIESADVILSDALVSDDILALANPAAEIIPVGKRAGRHSMPQAAINAALVAAARRHARVVRLKGGDPSLFGRLTEEIDALRRANIAFEVVPGITAACAAAAAAQVSLSQRGSARSVTFITGHAQAGEALDLDWQAAADARTTLAIYMGKSSAVQLQRQLQAAGMAADTPVIAVESAGRCDQHRISLRLASLDRLAAHPGSGPMVIIIGRAVDGALACQSLMSLDEAPSAPNMAW